MPDQKSPEKFHPITVVSQLTGWGRSKIYQQMALGKFPRPVRTSRKSVRWIESEIAAWQAARIAERDAANPTKH